MKAKKVFELVLSVNANERETYLKELCGDDSSLILQVKRMLAENRTCAGKPDLTVQKTGQMANRTPDNQHVASSRKDETKDSPSVGTVHSSIKSDSSSLTSGSFVGPYKLRDRLGQGVNG